jgi:TRAP-type mannitol/chloroaromatic compound transport system substrate-binding protein
MKNTEYFYKLKNEEKVDFREYPVDVLSKLKEYANEVIGDISGSNEMSTKIYKSYKKFHKNISYWHGISERNFN